MANLTEYIKKYTSVSIGSYVIIYISGSTNTIYSLIIIGIIIISYLAYRSWNNYIILKKNPKRMEFHENGNAKKIDW